MTSKRKVGGRLMASDRKYGQIEIPGIPDDEPVFVLRAQDKVAYTAISVYQGLAREAGATRAFTEGVAEVMREFTEWREANRNKVKTPD
jgi:hypothetical protein